MKGRRLNAVACSDIPQRPGVYILYNREGRLIYIGVAQRLKHRISSYYQKNGFLVPWEQQLKRNAASCTFKTTASIKAARKLEHSMIAKNKPYYNHYKK